MSNNTLLTIIAMLLASEIAPRLFALYCACCLIGLIYIITKAIITDKPYKPASKPIISLPKKIIDNWGHHKSIQKLKMTKKWIEPKDSKNSSAN